MQKPASVRAVVDGYLMGKKYFTIHAIKRILQNHDSKVRPVTLKQQLHNFTRESTLFDAGRGWYSTIQPALELNISPLQKIMRLIRTNFPQQQFSLWSAAQLEPYFEAHQSKLPFFLYTDKTFIPEIASLLKSKGYEPLPNPHTDEVSKFFHISEKSVIIRPSITEEPLDGNYATIEKILVDLYCEKDKTFLMDDSSYQQLFMNIVSFGRINMGRLLRYASRRKVKQNLIDKCLHNEKVVVS